MRWTPVALTEKRILFEMQTVDLDAGENHAASFATRSLTQRVPTLIDGDFALIESSAITEYPEELQPDPHFIPLIQKLVRVRARFRRGSEATSYQFGKSDQRM
jgi:glutathione S-transferase